MPTQQELLLSLGLKITITILGESYTVDLRGWNEDNYLITDIPKKPGGEVRVAPHTGCAIRFVREGVIITFNSVVDFIRPNANSFMLIKFPTNYKKIKLRKNDRIKVRLSVSFSQSVSGNGLENGVVMDLNMNGVLMLHAEPLKIGSKININLPLPDGAIDNIESTVCNVRHNPKNLKEPYIAGVRFLNLMDAQRDTLKKHIASLVGSA